VRVLRVILGFLAGYGISAASAILFFLAAKRDPHAPQPLWFIVATAVWGIAFALLGGFVAARIAGFRVGQAVGIAIIVVSFLSMIFDARGAHWSQVVAMVLMAPAAAFGASRGEPRRYARIRK
jgi:RsiW-degrading membrane proteinase PrsW (M82 family)